MSALPTHHGYTRRRHRRQGALAQRGAIGLFGALTLAMAILFSVLALDAGRLYLAKRALQNAADMAALSSARFTGCGTRDEDAQNAARQALQKSGLPMAGLTFSTLRGYITRDSDKRTVFNARNDESTNATQVTVSRAVPGSLIMGGLLQSDITLTASAIAEGGPPAAAFTVNSFMGVTDQQAKFITGMFRGILGNSTFNLTKDALTDLGKSTINLAKLQAAARAATIDELLDKRVPLSDLLKWISEGADTSGGAATQLSDIYKASLGSGLTVRIGDVLNVEIPATASVASAEINVFDLLQTSLMVGAKDSLIKFRLDGLQLLSGLNLFTVSLEMIDRPQLAVGPAGTWISQPATAASEWCTSAKSSGLKLIVGVQVPIVASLGIVVEVGKVNAMLTSLNVQPGALKGSIGVGSTLINFRLRDANDKGPAKLLDLGLLSGATIDIELPILEGKAKNTSKAAGGEALIDLTSTAPLPKRLETRGVAGSSVAGLIGPSTKIKVSVLGLPPVDAGKPIRDVLSPVLDLVGNGIITPFLNLLGLDVGLVQVTLSDVTSTPPILRK